MSAMEFIDILILAVALAMDCFTVSVVSGCVLKRWEGGVIVWMSFLFGLFQAAMPLLGWMATSRFAGYIESFDHWVAFALLLFLGVKMIMESAKEEEARLFNPHRLAVQLTLALATSIDALAVGISMAVMGYHTLQSLAFPLAVIGGVSMAFGLLGHLLGIRFGQTVSRKLRPELVGGLLLILIGVKVLLSHLLA